MRSFVPSKNVRPRQRVRDARHSGYRIKSSQFRQKTSSWATLANNGFAETGYTYDMNGNLLTLVRNDGRSSGSMDNLTYNYGSGGGNRLRKVTDSQDPFTGFIDGANSANEYTYDSAGNMIGDLNKNLIISYNHLNLPDVVRRGNDTVRYVYDASGRKLWHAAIFDRGVKQTDYAGEFIYENDALQFVNHEEGRIVIASPNQTYRNIAEKVDEFTAVNATLTALTQNGTESYIRVTSGGTTSRTGVFPIGPTSSFAVTAGEKYKIRVKGYTTGANAAYIQVKVGGADAVWPGVSIASGATSETWAEQLVTINGSGATTLQVGVNWNTVTNGEILYINEIEVTRLATTAPEYQYHLKDHLGNVRTTFTAKPLTTTTYTTNFESGSSPDFLNYTSTTFDLVDHTDLAAVYSKVQLLNGGVNGRTGVAKTFAVMPGDEVSISAYCKYMSISATPNPSPFITSLAAAFGVSASSTGEQLKLYNELNGFVGQVSGGLYGRDTQTPPMVFATILFFDKDFKLIDAAWDRVTATGAQTSGSVKQPPHDLVGITAKAPAAGYAYVFLSNEHPTYVDVYFDDVTVSFTPSMVVQVEDYYPFGLTFNSYSRESSVPQGCKYNGKDLQDELNLNWYDYGARMYDPTCGCWHSPDPHAENYLSTSPYAFAVNNPVLLKDDNGKDIIITNLSESQQKSLAQFAATKEGKAFLSQFAVQGKEYNIGGEKFKFEVSKSSNHDIVYQTGDVSGQAETKTYVYNPVSGKYVDVYGISSRNAKAAFQNGNPKAKIEVTIDTDSKNSLYTIGHESFVHADQNLSELNQASNDYKSGKHAEEAKASPLGLKAENVLSAALTKIAFGPSDHKLLVNGKVVKLERFVKELDKLFKTSKFSEQYKKDQKVHKNNPGM